MSDDLPFTPQGGFLYLGRRAICVALALGVVTTGCTHGGKKTTGTTARVRPSTTVSNGAVYAGPGNFTVGVATLHLSTGNAVEVWYPANGAVAVGSDTYDVQSFLPPSIAERLGPTGHGYVRTVANRNAPVGAPGERFPLVLFSHGYAGFRDQSTFLMTWLASWGMVVAAPDHPSRDLSHVLARSAVGVPTDVDDLLATADLMQAENARVGGPFKDRIDLSKIAAVGYDAGGGTAIGVATDPRVDGYVLLASDARAATGSRRSAGTGLPAKPSLFVAGADDRVVTAAATHAVYRLAPAPSYEWVLDGAGHNAFDDLCVVATAQGGLVAMADKAGIGARFSATLRNIVTDGCLPPDLAVIKIWPIVNQVVTAFLRNVIGPDRKLVGVGAAGTRTIAGVKVTVSARLG